MDFRPEHLFGDAIEAARHALRDLDPAQVPASVKRVAGYSGGTLPPPFARSLLAELAKNEFLRSKALEAWAGDRPPADGRPLASYRFLERQEGWSIEMAETAYLAGVGVSEKEDRALAIEREERAAEIASLRQQLKTLRTDLETVERDLRAERRVGRDPIRQERAAERRTTEKFDELKNAHRAEVDALEGRLGAVRAELASAREGALADRRLRAEAESAHREAVAPQPPSIDPDALATRLDVMAALAVASGPGAELDEAPQTEGGAEAAIVYPRVIRPDSAEAVDWLVTAGASTVLIDGYNVGYLFTGGLDPARARSLAIEAVGRLASMASQASIIVVFDSQLQEDDSRPAGSGQVEVVFSRGSADDEIVGRIGGLPNPVVVSNDRDLRHRAEAAGAITLWSDALVEWSRRR